MTQFVDEDDAGLNDRNCEDGFSILTRGSQLVGHDFPDLVNEESSATRSVAWAAVMAIRCVMSGLHSQPLPEVVVGVGA